MLRRNVKRQIRYPSIIVMLIAMPAIFLVLFVYVFGGQLGVGLPQVAAEARPVAARTCATSRRGSSP